MAERFSGDGAAANGLGRRHLHEDETRLLYEAEYPIPPDMRVPEAWSISAGGVLEAQLPEGKRFFGGDAIGFLDIAAGGALAHWMGMVEEMASVRLLTEEDHPALCRWARAYRADETVRRCLPDRDRVLVALAARKDLYVSIAKAMAAQK